MSYMTLSSQEKPLFQKRIPWWHLFLLCSYFRAHPTTLLLKILGGRLHRPSPHLKFFGGPFPHFPLRSPPLVQLTIKQSRTYFDFESNLKCPLMGVGTFVTIAVEVIVLDKIFIGRCFVCDELFSGNIQLSIGWALPSLWWTLQVMMTSMVICLLISVGS